MPKEPTGQRWAVITFISLERYYRRHNPYQPQAVSDAYVPSTASIAAFDMLKFSQGFHRAIPDRWDELDRGRWLCSRELPSYPMRLVK